MKKHSMPDMKEGGVNVTPLIDVVMCLIIFFMLVAKIGVTTGAEEMKHLVESVLGTKIEDMGNTITLNIKPLPGWPSVTAVHDGQMKPTAINRVDLLRVLKAIHEKNKDFKVILRGESNTPFSELGLVMGVITESGIDKMAFNTKEKQELAPASP